MCTYIIYTFASSHILPILLCMQERGVMEIAVVPSCADLLVYDIWSFCTTLFKLSLDTAGLILVFLTRKVKVTILNEANYVSAIIIANFIFVIMVVTIVVVVDVSESALRLVEGILLFMATGICLGLTFVPKVYYYVLEKGALITFLSNV